MLHLLLALLATARSSLKPRRELALQNLALRQQLAILKRKTKGPKLTQADRAFWVALCRLWPDWQNALILVKPETVIGWHRKGFKLYWTRKSRNRGGRPPIDREIRALIRGEGTHDQREIHRKKRIIEYAERVGNVNKTCRYFGVARSTFYLWRDRYRELGEEGLRSRRCGSHNHPNKTPDEVVEKILHLRRTYHMGPIRIVWYLRRYHDIQTSDTTVYRVCKRHGLNRLPNRVGRRAVHTHRYEKQVPGHHVQVDVKFLTLIGKKGRPVRRYQYTAIDDATRVRALQIYRRHTHANAIDFINYAVEKFPFRIKTIRTDRGHEFQALFHWHVADLGMEHVYIKPRTPQLNGKVERSHRTDKDEFYQLLTYRDDVDLEKKLPSGNASTTLTDPTVRTAAKRRMKLYGRNYPSEKRPA